MTHEEKLQAITADIREKLPRLMEIEKGCFIQNDVEIWELWESEDKKTIPGLRISILGNESRLFNIEDLKKDQEYKIIGKEPMLNDVLEYLDVINIEIKLMATNREGASVLYLEKDEWTIEEWDLFNPYLKDQSEEVITFLYGLL